MKLYTFRSSIGKLGSNTEQRLRDDFEDFLSSEQNSVKETIQKGAELENSLVPLNIRKDDTGNIASTVVKVQTTEDSQETLLNYLELTEEDELKINSRELEDDLDIIQTKGEVLALTKDNEMELFIEYGLSQFIIDKFPKKSKYDHSFKKVNLKDNLRPEIRACDKIKKVRIHLSEDLEGVYDDWIDEQEKSGLSSNIVQPILDLISSSAPPRIVLKPDKQDFLQEYSTYKSITDLDIIDKVQVFYIINGSETNNEMDSDERNKLHLDENKDIFSVKGI